VVLASAEKEEVGPLRRDFLKHGGLGNGMSRYIATKMKYATWEQQAIRRLGEPGDVTGAVLFRER
jgi:hypothetical protein